MAKKKKIDAVKSNNSSPITHLYNDVLYEPKPIKSELERLIDQKEEMFTKLRSGVNISSRDILAIKNKIAELENNER